MHIAMKITTKGQVTIPQHVRERAHMPPNSEVEFEVRAVAGGQVEVIIKPVRPVVSAARRAFEQARGSANAASFKGMGTDQFMQWLRG
jgi:AbrB family looped-hinge helix DNA binding protein